MRPPLSRPVLVALCLAANAGILLAPALLLGLGPRVGGLELALFLAGASALCLADAAGQDDARSQTSAPARNLAVERLAWVQALSVLATFQVAIVGHLSRRETLRLDEWRVASGIALVLSGALLRYAAIRTLGRLFVTEIRTGTELVRSGVYGHIRHPSESGLLLAVAGSTLLLSSPPALGVLTFVLLPAVVVRTCKEDAALSEAFPTAHVRYTQEAGRFLPRLRRCWPSAARPVARTLLGGRPS